MMMTIPVFLSPSGDGSLSPLVSLPDPTAFPLEFPGESVSYRVGVLSFVFLHPCCGLLLFFFFLLLLQASSSSFGSLYHFRLQFRKEQRGRHTQRVRHNNWAAGNCTLEEISPWRERRTRTVSALEGKKKEGRKGKHKPSRKQRQKETMLC